MTVALDYTQITGSGHVHRGTQLASAAAGFLDLRIWAETFNDAQQHRIAMVNRMERGGIDADLLAVHRQMLEADEHAFRLAMTRSYRAVIREHMPAVEEWQKTHYGIGEPLLARLLGHLGHPVYATPYRWMDEAPDGHVCIEERCGKRHLVAFEPFARTPGQLWQYCGHGAPGKRRQGMTQDDALALGNPKCKMLTHLLAESAMKVNPERTVKASLKYRHIYDERKASTGDREWTDGHRHADALRIVGKNILLDLWKAAGGDQIIGGTR